MTLQATAGPVPRHWTPERVIRTAGLTLCLSYAAVLIGSWFNGYWLFDGQGRAIANDFVNVWAAGKLALAGHAADAYDWSLHKLVEIEAVGYDFGSYYGWHYPPMFLAVASALALLPYTAAAVTWLVATLPPYIAAMRAIAGPRAGLWLALGSPAALWNITAGQNGFLTASLIGGTLALLERRPALAGICLGLLSFKPHFGLLFPLALVAGGYWRTIAVAAATATITIALSLLVFGQTAWLAFFHWMPITGQVVLGDGAADWNRLQSLFGLVRAFGGGATFAWSVQIGAAAILALSIVAIWRSSVAFELKAAALGVAAVLATPYLYTYDLVALTVPAAFLVRLGLRRGFDAVDIAALSGGILLLLIFPYARTQCGLAAALLMAAAVARHAVIAATPSRAA